MKKSDLKTGMHVITRNLREYVVVLDIYDCIEYGEVNNVIIGVSAHGWINLGSYTEDLRPVN